MPIQNIVGITVSIHPNSAEFVFHFKLEPDFRIKSDCRRKIVDWLKKYKFDNFNENMPVFGIRAKRLMDYATKDKDLAKGISRMPLDLARIPDSDLLQGKDFKDMLKSSNFGEGIKFEDESFITKEMKEASKTSVSEMEDFS